MEMEILLYKWGDEGAEAGLGASLVARGRKFYTKVTLA